MNDNPKENPKILQLLPAAGWVVRCQNSEVFDLIAFALLQGTDGSTWVDAVMNFYGYPTICAEYKRSGDDKPNFHFRQYEFVRES